MTFIGNRRETKLIVNKYITGLGLIICLFLAGCSEPEPAEILEEVNQAQQELISVEVEFEENRTDEISTGNAIFNYEHNVDYYNMNEADFASYRDEGGYYIEYDDGMVAEPFAAENTTELDLAESNLNNQLDFIKMPLTFLVELDADIYNKFDMETSDNNYVLTYNGDQTEKENLARAIVEQPVEAMSYYFGTEIEQSDINIDVFSLEIIIEKDTNRLQQVEQELTYSFDVNDFSDEQHFIYMYSNHDEAEQIDIPEVTMNPNETDITATETAEQEPLSDEEQETLENESAAYLDALIQATVFQDAEEFINRAPDSYPEEEKTSEAETQRDFFREMYIQNTQQNMLEANVTEEEITDLAEAFMHALSTTDYEIVGADAESADNIIVTVSIEGINDTSVNLETEQELIALYEDGEVADDEIESKNLEILTEKYYDIDEILAPVEIEVHVMQDDDGTYAVLLQDQYLAGFVQ